MARIHRTREKRKTHVTVVIENDTEKRTVFWKLKEALARMQCLLGISYVITEVDFLAAGEPEREVGEMKCKECGNVVNEEDNFCSACGAKLRKVCNCWIEKDNYDCGESSCPGYGLNKLKKLQSK